MIMKVVTALTWNLLNSVLTTCMKGIGIINPLYDIILCWRSLINNKFGSKYTVKSLKSCIYQLGCDSNTISFPKERKFHLQTVNMEF